MDLVNLREMMDPSIFDWFVLPAIIFFARLTDVTLGTLRILFISRSLRYTAPVVGFFESLIWLFAISQIVQNLNNAACYFAFASGFASGSYVGIFLENKLAMGLVCVRAVTPDDASELIHYLREHQFGVTSVSAMGVSGQVRLIWSVIKRKEMPAFMNIVKTYNPKAFISVEDVRTAHEGFFPPKDESAFRHLGLQRK
jgi:uncharacterized protein YebE (UPF0316 family)